jgi:hypothetical protein
MIRAFVCWMRQVLPPDATVGSFLVVYATVVAMYLHALWRWGPAAVMAENVLVVRDVVLIAAAALYGSFRVAAMHPILRPDYRKWLWATPWTRDKPLPLGPIHLVLQDGLVLAVLWGLMHSPQLPRLLLLLFFLLAYLGTLALALATANRFWHACLIVFGMGLAVFKVDEPLPSGLVLAAVYMVAYTGLRRSLADFPWRQTVDVKEAIVRINRGTADQTALGWPYDQVSPKPTMIGISHEHGMAVSLLAGWWTFVIFATLPVKPAVMLTSAILMTTTFACTFGRLGLYCTHRRSPINFWGRLWTLRWIIPSHDKVFVAPLCVPLALAACGWLAVRQQLSPGVSLALAETAMLLVTLNLGPRLADWQLTGGHRIKPSPNNELIKL